MTSSKKPSNKNLSSDNLYAIAETSGQQFWFEVDRYYDIDRLEAKEKDKILATPTLAKILPPPVRRIIGDLSDREKVLIGLDLLFDELSESEYTLSLIHI